MIHGYYPTTYCLDGDSTRECPAWLLVTVHPGYVTSAPTFGCHDAACEAPTEVQFHSLIADGTEFRVEDHGALDEVSAEILRAWERGELELSEVPFRSIVQARRIGGRAA